MKIIPNTKIRIGTRFSYLDYFKSGYTWIIIGEDGDYWVVADDNDISITRGTINKDMLFDDIKSNQRKIVYENNSK